MEKQQHGSSKTQDRKTMERKRRSKMKALYSELSFLISSHDSNKEAIVPKYDQLDEAVNYIKKLEKKLESLKEKKESLMGINGSKSKGMISGTGMAVGSSPTHFDIRVTGSALEVVLISGMDSQFMFFEMIRMIHEEGADVVNASFCVVEDNIIHTIHSEVNNC